MHPSPSVGDSNTSSAHRHYTMTASKAEVDNVQAPGASLGKKNDREGTEYLFKKKMGKGLGVRSSSYPLDPSALRAGHFREKSACLFCNVRTIFRHRYLIVNRE